jgi:hypothetical protein
VIRVQPQADEERDGWLRRSARVEGLSGGDAELWFDIEPRHAGLLTHRADPWTLALLFAAMRSGSPLVVTGEVSRELLRNLEALEQVWRLWAPDRYRPVPLVAASEATAVRPESAAGRAVMAFAGGLDECYSAWRHTRVPAGRRRLDLVAGLLVLGLGEAPEAGESDETGAIDHVRALCDDLGLDLWTMRTNARRFAPIWDHAYGAVLASCLHWYSGGVSAGMLAATGSLSHLNVHCGSHPLTDPLLGSDRLRVVHDGAEQDFVAKARVVAAWPEAARRLGAGRGPNGVLAGLALAVAAPPGHVDVERVRSLPLESSREIRDAMLVLRAAETGGLQAPPWYEPLRERLGRLAPGTPEPPLDGASRRPRDTGPYWPPRRRAAPEIHVFPETPRPVDDRVMLAARIEGLGAETATLWFSVEARHARYLSDLGDPFACALQIPAMRAGAALAIHAPVSRALLENLEQFQEIWRAWAPDQVAPVPMRADVEVDGGPPSDDALMLFSGGLDSSFSLYRHHRGVVGRRTRSIAAGLMVLGFDIFHSETDEFRASLANSRRMLESLGIDLWSMATNFRELVPEWEPGHGTAIAACAHCFAGRFGTALVASTAPANSLDRPWGSHVMTDRLLGSDRLRVITDGEDVLGRLDKAPLLSEWPAAMRGLRVCSLSARRDRNCGACPKCILSALAFLANGLPLPSTLRRPTRGRLRRLPLRAAWEVRVIQNVLERARSAGVAGQPWCAALRDGIRWNEGRWASSDGDDPLPITGWRQTMARLARAPRRLRRALGRGR